MEFFTMIDWSVVIQIIIIDLLLGGDNAVVIALACRNLHPNQRRKGIIWGTAGAIILRVILDVDYGKPTQSQQRYHPRVKGR